MAIYLKIHKSYRRVVAFCDCELVGKRFEEGKIQLEVRENFFKDREVDEDEVKKILKREQAEDATFNIVGKNAVKIALDVGLISEGNVGKVDGVPFALVLL